MNLAPVFEERVLYGHAVGEEERETRTFVGEHEELHVLAYLPVVASLGFLLKFYEVVELL